MLLNRFSCNGRDLIIIRSFLSGSVIKVFGNCQTFEAHKINAVVPKAICCFFYTVLYINDLLRDILKLLVNIYTYTTVYECTTKIEQSPSADLSSFNSAIIGLYHSIAQKPSW